MCHAHSRKSIVYQYFLVYGMHFLYITHKCKNVCNFSKLSFLSSCIHMAAVLRREHSIQLHMYIYGWLTYVHTLLPDAY